MVKTNEEPKNPTVADDFLENGKWEEAAPKAWWAVMEEGLTFCAIPRDREKRYGGRNDSGKDQFILTLEITEPGNLKLQKGSDTTADEETRNAEQGDVVKVDEKARLRSVGECADDTENIWEVKILCLGKVKIQTDDGKPGTMYNFKVGKRRLTARKSEKTGKRGGNS
jgi:hypothetical protein